MKGIALIVLGGAVLVAAAVLGPVAFAGKPKSGDERPNVSRVDLVGVNFVENCRYSHQAPDDPIVFPGQPGLSHQHTFVGNRTTDAFSSFGSLRSGGTTCMRQDDTAAYWVPALYQGATAVLPVAATVYYRRGTLADVSPFPNNLRMIAGDAKATSPQGMRITFWSCGVGSGVDRSAEVPTCPDTRGSFLRLHIRFPECWDGRRLDSADHKSHMAYAVRGRVPVDAPGRGAADHADLPLSVPRRRELRARVGRRLLGPRGLRERVEAGHAEEARRGLPQRPRPLRSQLRIRFEGSRPPTSLRTYASSQTAATVGRVTALRSLAILLVLLGVSGSAAQGSQASAAPPVTPVPSLEPAKTAALWKSLVAQQPQSHSAQAQAACRPLRAVLYAASDWLRLATKLAAARSPCADYSISVPPLVADKTQFRRDQASRIRALGPNFHALAEIHFTTWSRWVASTGNSWHTAGVTARARMAEAGYDVAKGDSWALNELTTAVRRGDGNARANIREFLRGLYEGDGSRPTRGAVLIVGFGQRTSALAAYQNTLQNWLADTAFWTDMTTYVSDWSQEVYGDLRAHAVPGEAVSVRREYLNDYLQHPLVLAAAGPTAIEPARSFLQAAYSPLANGAWPRETAWGWTMVPMEQMAAYISAQVDAMRYFTAATGQARDHWGFAWAPSNTTGMSAGDFATQTGQLLDRLAAAIHDSAEATDPVNSGTNACGPPGQDTLCLVDIPGASHNAAWQSFRTWTQPLLAIVPTTQSVTAGTPSAPSTVSLTTAAGTPVSSGPPLTVTLGSSSPRGTFATSPAGPWTTTLALTVAPGISGTFYYRDTLAGSATVTASAVGATAGTQTVTVVAGPVARVTIAPAAGTVRVRGTRAFSAVSADAYGNAVRATFAWRVLPKDLGAIAARPDGSAVFTAARRLGSGRVTTTVAGSAGRLRRPR